jgi:integrase
LQGSLVKKGKYWYVVVDIRKDEKGKRQQKWHNTKCMDRKEALKAKRQILVTIDNGTYVEPSKKTFSEFILEWLDEEIKDKKEKTTYYSYKQTINKHIVPYFQNIKLQSLQPIHIQKFYNHLLRIGLSANTVKHHHANIHKCLKYALRMGMITRNSADAIELPKVEKYQAKYYDKKEIQMLLKAVKGTYVEVPVTITIGMGLRRGEVLGLKWDNINLGAKEMFIAKSRVRQGKEKVLKSTKTEKSRRVLVIPDYIIKYLKQLKLQQKKDKLFFGNTYNGENYICCTPQGYPLGITYVSRIFKKILADNGLPEIRFHDMRHSNASYLLKQGVTMKELQEWLGHSSIATTADIYAHVDAEMKKSIARKSNTMFKNVQ